MTDSIQIEDLAGASDTNYMESGLDSDEAYEGNEVALDMQRIKQHNKILGIEKPAGSADTYSTTKVPKMASNISQEKPNNETSAPLDLEILPLLHISIPRAVI